MMFSVVQAVRLHQFRVAKAVQASHPHDERPPHPIDVGFSRRMSAKKENSSIFTSRFVKTSYVIALVFILISFTNR